MYSYSKFLWLKIIVILAGIAYFVKCTLQASTSYISTELLAPDDYSTGFEILLDCVVLACFVNYLIVCLLRFKDCLVVSDGVLEIVAHKNTLFLLSRKHVKVNVNEVREFRVLDVDVAGLFSYGTKLKLHLSDDKWHTYPLLSIAVKTSEVHRLLLDNNIRYSQKPEVKVSKFRENMIVGIISMALSAIVLGVSFALLGFLGNAFMPNSLWFQIGIIGICLSLSLRDTFSVPFIICVFISPFLGAILYVAALAYNYYGVDKSKTVMMEYRVGRCYSVYHPGSGSGRHHRRRPPSTSYHLILCSKETGREVKTFDITKRLYEKGRHAESVKMPISRGALGYPITDMDEMEFHNKTMEDRAKIHALRDSNMQERQKILKELRRMRRTSRSTKAKAIGIDSLQRLLDKLRREDRKYHY